MVESSSPCPFYEQVLFFRYNMFHADKISCGRLALNNDDGGGDDD